ncbi:hypothetical protein THERMOT_747 [Bathymodiolus thermophilus thioautotrophic gill symbiont]|nr:hypothetical protein THERMOT_747 [Bathymodiolus thermophilus thioautotrophic gill symbiont]
MGVRLFSLFLKMALPVCASHTQRKSEELRSPLPKVEP